ncbi:MAG: ATP-binding protein [Deltaproteobacteria bacterium]|jgi:hypothetical protein|nr:ATP-binding protein [Deltaproteobacteria bacterium]
MFKPPIKIFNTAGPCIPADHYMVPVLSRLPIIDYFLDHGSYFTLHAPRQSGKTTLLYALTDDINARGQSYALYCSLELLEGITDTDTALTLVVSQILKALNDSEIEAFKKLSSNYGPGPSSRFDAKILDILRYLSVNLDKDLVVFFDDVDSLSDKPLIPFLRQIHFGFNTRFRSRNTKFPKSMALVGMRHLVARFIQSSPDSASISASNILSFIKESLTLPDFNQNDIKVLCSQHALASGQIFNPSAINRIWYWSEGQPWLVNALTFKVVTEFLNYDYSKSITDELVEQAAEAITQGGYPHIDYLMEQSKELRVKRVMKTVIFDNSSFLDDVLDDDKRHVLDLGLIKKVNRTYQPANPLFVSAIFNAFPEKSQAPPTVGN